MSLQTLYFSDSVQTVKTFLFLLYFLDPILVYLKDLSFCLNVFQVPNSFVLKCLSKFLSAKNLRISGPKKMQALS